MSVRTDVINLNVNVNGNNARNELNNLQKKAADIKLEMQGLTKGTAEYIAKGKELAQVTSEMDKLKKQIGITSLTQKELIAELNKLKALRGSVQPFTDEYKKLSVSIKEVENRLYDVKNGVQGFASFFSKIKDEVKQFGIVAAGYLGFQFLTSQFTNIIRGAGKLSDQLADLRRVAGLTADEADHLNKQFKELNTRTSTEGLREIAIIAGKLGVAKEDIFDFTKAVDQLVVSLGDELGNADQITTQLGKILNVFNGHIDAEGLTGLGNAFVELANTGAATGGFIADFDQRLSGIAKSAGIGLGALSGLGAGLEEMGGRVESSATAIQKLIISISADLPAAAKIAGQSTEEFKKLFKLDPTEALLKYSEGLVKNKQSFAEVTASLKDAGEEGARTIETITKLGTGADKLRERIDLGKKSIQESSAITEAFALKNETFGATLDKLGKEFNKLVTSPGVTNFLKGAVEGALSFIKVLRDIPEFLASNKIALLTLLAGVLLYNKAMITSALVTIRDSVVKTANAVATRAVAIATTLAEVAQAAYVTVTTLLAGRITLATAAQRLWNIAVSLGAGPIGIIISAVSALVIGFTALINSSNKFTATQRAANDLAKESAQIYGDQVNTVERLEKILTSSNASLDLKKEAYKQLIAIHPEFQKTLELDTSGHLKGVEAINAYIKSLKDKAEVQAAETLSNKTYQEILEKQQQLEEVHNKFTLFGRTREKHVLLDEIADLVKRKQYYDDLITKKIAANASTSNTSSTSNTGSNSGDAANIVGNTIATIKAKLKELDDAYENIDISNKKALKSNRDARKALQDELDALEGKKSPGAKKDDAEAKRLRAEFLKFQKELAALKDRTAAGDNPEDQEVQRVTAKYQELLQRAKDFYIKSASTKKAFTEEEKIIEEAKQKELNEIFEKYFKKRFNENSAKEYDDSLAARSEFSDKLKIAAAKDYTDGKISKAEYERSLVQIERDETKDRVIIAEDYSTTVKKAAADVHQFRKKEEQETTDDILKETEARKQLAADEANSKLDRAVLTTRPGSKANYDAQKARLKKQEEDAVQALKDEYAAKGIVIDEGEQLILDKRAEFAQKQEDLDKEHVQHMIDNVAQYVGYVTQALTSLNQYINNKENAQFAKEKQLNDKKRKELKSQLDNKLISQAQYDKKMQALQEDQDKKEAELKRKQAKREKALNIFRAIVNVAAGVASSLAYGGPVGIALAAITAVLGALEIAAIASEPLPEVGTGKWFTEGDKHSDPSGGIPVKIERDEAVMKASAMTDKNRYTVSGTPAQITGALNGQAGGPNWAGGAIVKKMPHIAEKPKSINSGIVAQLALGGFDPSKQAVNRSASGGGEEDTNGLLRTLIAKTEENTSAIANLDRELHAVVSIKEYREKEKQYDASQKLSGLAKAK